MDPRATAFLRLLTIMDELRAQCPWDRKPTMGTQALVDHPALGAWI